MKLMSFERQFIAGFGAVIDAGIWGFGQTFSGLYVRLNDGVQRHPIPGKE